MAAASSQLALVPQLASALGPAADAVAVFGEMGPGIPWSDALLEQMLEGVIYFRMDEKVDDEIDLNITMLEQSVRRKPSTIHVTIVNTRQHGMLQTIAAQDFPRSVAGFRQAIELSQKHLARVRTRGYCPCYKRAPGAWRSLQIMKTGKCRTCVLNHCLKK